MTLKHVGGGAMNEQFNENWKWYVCTKSGSLNCHIDCYIWEVPTWHGY